MAHIHTAMHRILTDHIPRPLLIAVANLAVFALLVVILEAGSALFVDKPGGTFRPHYYLNHTWKPNFEWKLTRHIRKNPDFPDAFTMKTNAQGWLETYDVQKDKAPGVYRIFYVGDSFTQGTCAREQSVASIVELALNERAQGTDTSFEVINTGTASYSPIIYYLLLRHVLIDYEPDLIIVNIDLTDDFDDWKYGQTLVLDDEGNPFAAPKRSILDASFLDTVEGPVEMTTLIRLQLYLYQNSYTYNLIMDTLSGGTGNTQHASEGQRASLAYKRWSWCQEVWDRDTWVNVRKTLDTLRRLVKLSRENGAKVMMTSVPHYWNYAANRDGTGKPKYTDQPHVTISELAEELGVPYLNSFEELKTRVAGTPQSRYYFTDNIHFNPRGYAIWADAHLSFLLDTANTLLPADLNR